MSQTASMPFEPITSPFGTYDAEMDQDSPFGLQGLTRGKVRVLKSEYIERLAVELSLRGTRAQIEDAEFVGRVMSYHPDWFDEYQIIHLIETSLWIQGRNDLVMTMTRNPAQIPDNPPPKILDALSRAYTLHPDATIWYGVPLFGDEKNSDGLPIPVTAAEVREEAAKRIQAAQEHALRWGFGYRTFLKVAQLPVTAWNCVRVVGQRIRNSFGRVRTYCQKVRAESHYRVRAAIKAELERCRCGRAETVVPEHTTALGRGLEVGALGLEIIHYQLTLLGHVAPYFAASGLPLAFATFVPKLLIPLTVISIDPFLFVELPEEPGKLRHVGHWYWQEKSEGEQTLHLHV